MEPKYNPSEVESKIYQMWESGDYFSPRGSKTGENFCIVLPPPNANAPLHLGHAMYAVEDILIRYHRMLGDSTLWLPGADHAGFETQVVYEKQLIKEGKSRFDFDRAALYKNIWDFVIANRSTMENQLKRLGFSLDWKRIKFTLDPNIVKTTYETFKKLYDDGLVYRDHRLVNYCTKHGTGFSDLEVDHEERNEFLYYIEFPVVGESIGLTIATARPETIPGDVGIAVHPNDKRYKKYVGMTAVNPVNGKKIPIIADDFVKKDFGTGVVKLTSAHDENDFVVCKKHNLPMVQIIGYNGKLTKEAGEFEGLKVIDAREKILEKLKKNGLFKESKQYLHNVPLCYKCGSVLEPLPLPQWYIKTKPLAKKALDAVKTKKIEIYPARLKKIYSDWLNKINDWNISRQVVWGMRIPAWQCLDCNEWIITNGETPTSCKCGKADLKQDTDTFDTWFSSGQWPFSTLGFPDNEDFMKFYPTSVMETAYDIIFFWVARMVMLGIYVTGGVPFKNVYFHGLVRDSKGQKMSKSKGNVLNPMELVEKYGCDALRMSLIANVAPGADQNFAESKIINYRNFTNKLWNIARFILTDEKKLEAINSKHDESLRYLIRTTVRQTNRDLGTFKLGVVADRLYNIAWHEFADVIIENYKLGLVSYSVLLESFLILLKLLHPFMPFVTEEIWSLLPHQEKTPLIISSWPKV